MEYKGYKLLDKIMLVCRDPSERNNSGKENYYQAYLVDPTNTSQLASARNWAEWTEYGPRYLNTEGKWGYEFKIDHKPVEFNFENNGFTLELLDCAGGSSQGGKLSFWNCLVSKDGNKFKIGINSEMLLNLLKNATFIEGKCQSPLIFITQKGKVGMTTEGSDLYKQCIKDCELKKSISKQATSKYTFGDILKTTTLEEIYLGTITQYYTFAGDTDRYHHWDCIDYKRCALTKLAKPITYHIFGDSYRKNSISDFITELDGLYRQLEFKKTCPKRAINGKLNLDYTEEFFKQHLISKLSDYESFAKVYRNCFTDDFYSFLTKNTFGFGFEPFELDPEFMAKIKALGIEYIDETEVNK